MRVLQVNNIDLHGRRFNGYDLLDELRDRDVVGAQVVMNKLSKNPNVTALLTRHMDLAVQDALCRVEQRHSMNDLLFPWGRVLAELPEFVEADVVHYHLLHNQMISVLDLPWLFEKKPTVWTFHDAWPLTGHCIQPVECERWLSGCVGCPALEVPFAMREDCAHMMWRIKQRTFSKLDVDIVVASEYMRDMVARSPLTAHFQRVHVIPFGIDASLFLPDEERLASREALGIPPDDFVIFFRSADSEYKGLRYIIEALQSHAPMRSTTLLAVDQLGHLKSLRSRYNIVELGWVNDEKLYPKLFSAADVFLMPSTVEGFGLMALEAMSAGRPVVCFEGTAVPQVTHEPECVIAVPKGDAVALRAAIDRLAADPEEAHRRGELGRRIAAEQYSHGRYLDTVAALYRSVRGGDVQ